MNDEFDDKNNLDYKVSKDKLKEINKRRDSEPDPEWDEEWGENPIAKNSTTNHKPEEGKQV